MEDNSNLIRILIGYGSAAESDTVTIDGRRYWCEDVAVRHPEDPADDATGVGQGRRILFELQPTAKTDENRVHLDLNVGESRLSDETTRLVGLGATLLYERRDPPRGLFNRLADPEGNEFCLQ